MNLEEKLYTSTEVAKVLGVSLRSVYRYLDQGKLDAEIKTATGRLRFTRQDILNFLYPNGDVDTSVIDSRFSKVADLNAQQKEDNNGDITPNVFSKTKKVSEDASENAIEEPLSDEDMATEEENLNQSQVEPEESKEEEIDWLAKFRAAAKEYSMEKETPVTVTPEKPTSAKTPQAVSPKSFKPVPDTQPVSKMDSLSSLNDSVEEENIPNVQCSYYKSLLGGLKEIAQNIDRVARKSAVDYAFTLYAGLSLEKPLRKPFSILHVYVDSSTEALFQKMLQLEEVDEPNAQLCLMYPQNSKIFANKVEKHGLYVVDSAQMEEDFDLMGLSEEFETLL
jgi:excisionase family DNA binding protein